MAAGLKGFDHLRQGGGDNGMMVKARFPARIAAGVVLSRKLVPAAVGPSMVSRFTMTAMKYRLRGLRHPVSHPIYYHVTLQKSSDNGF